MSTQWVDRDTIDQIRRALLRLHNQSRVFIIVTDSGSRIL